MREILLATRNRHKTREFAQLLGGNYQVRDLNARPEIQPGRESGVTFAENAIAKAMAAARQVGGMVLADDSGLEVEALQGRPGLFSARYAGEEASDAGNVEKLLRELAAATNRAARFRCVLALARDAKLLLTCEGVVEGSIALAPAGKNGFGYDPVFVPQGFGQTFAELPAALKNEMSHRARAIAVLREKLAMIR
jgi:XTP/dITP diphosphohydrolase